LMLGIAIGALNSYLGFYGEAVKLVN